MQMIDYYSPCPGEELVNGYGLVITRFNPSLFNGHNIIGHGGDAPGYAAGSFYLPDYGICIGIMDNTDGGDVMYIINDLIDVIINQ
jgi:hypothetical protein